MRGQFIQSEVGICGVGQQEPHAHGDGEGRGYRHLVLGPVVGPECSLDRIPYPDAAPKNEMGMLK